jgi:hypothetical protein
MVISAMIKILYKSFTTETRNTRRYTEKTEKIMRKAGVQEINQAGK